MSIHRRFYVAPGNNVRGADHHSARLTAESVLDMRVRRAAGESLKDISATYPQCSKPAVHHVLAYRTWKHVALPAEVEAAAHSPAPVA